MNEWKITIKSSGYMNCSLTILDAPYNCTLKGVGPALFTQFDILESITFTDEIAKEYLTYLARKNEFELQMSTNIESLISL